MSTPNEPSGTTGVAPEPATGPIAAIQWQKYPRCAACPPARAWVKYTFARRDAKTGDAYARGVDAFLAFLAALDGGRGVAPGSATMEHGALYLNYMRGLAGRDGSRVLQFDSGAGLANATMQQRLTAVRLWYEQYMLRKGIAREQPVPRGTFNRATRRSTPGMLRREHRLPWIPTDEQWHDFLDAARDESLRNRLMVAMGFEGALRREELVLLDVQDVDLAHRTVDVRAENAKNGAGRVVSFTATTARLYQEHVLTLKANMRAHPRRCDPKDKRLFRSQSDRNWGRPVSIWSWNKIVKKIALRADLPRMCPHTFRHLYLTHLARVGWDVLEIATYAGHRSTVTTMLYIHLSGRELAPKVARTTARVQEMLTRLENEWQPKPSREGTAP